MFLRPQDIVRRAPERSDVVILGTKWLTDPPLLRNAPYPPKGNLRVPKGLWRLSIEIIAFPLNYNQIECLQIWGQKGRYICRPLYFIHSPNLIYPLYFTCPSAPPSFILYLLQLFYFYTDILTSPPYCPYVLSIYFYCPPTFPFLFFFFL